MKIHKNYLTPINWSLYSLLGLILAFFLAWILLAKVDFGYSLLHDAMNIQKHAEKYGPQNRYRNGFQHTNKQEHVRLFSQINNAIHDHGNGLKSIQYQHTDGRVLGTLLHHAEIVHLKDVANLLDLLLVIAGLASVAWVTFVCAFSLEKIPMPNFNQQLKGILGLTAFCTLLVLLIGPVTIFYAFHEWIFPDNHKWFFYYQESLMTILMKAPDLFGAIAIFLTSLALIIFILMNTLAYRVRDYVKTISTIFTAK